MKLYSAAYKNLDRLSFPVDYSDLWFINDQDTFCRQASKKCAASSVQTASDTNDFSKTTSTAQVEAFAPLVDEVNEDDHAEDTALQVGDEEESAFVYEAAVIGKSSPLDELDSRELPLHEVALSHKYEVLAALQDDHCHYRGAPKS